jgi:hypothetical protein
MVAFTLLETSWAQLYAACLQQVLHATSLTTKLLSNLCGTFSSRVGNAHLLYLLIRDTAPWPTLNRNATAL